MECTQNFRLAEKDRITEKKVSHCSVCNVCIEELDHHCGFFDRCIGGNNITLFTIVVCGYLLALGYSGLLAATTGW